MQCECMLSAYACQCRLCGASVPSRLKCRNASAKCMPIGASSLGFDTASAAALALLNPPTADSPHRRSSRCEAPYRDPRGHDVAPSQV